MQTFDAWLQRYKDTMGDRVAQAGMNDWATTGKLEIYLRPSMTYPGQLVEVANEGMPGCLTAIPIAEYGKFLDRYEASVPLMFEHILHPELEPFLEARGWTVWDRPAGMTCALSPLAIERGLTRNMEYN